MSPSVDDLHDDILSLIFDELAQLDPPGWSNLRDTYRDNLALPSYRDPWDGCYSLGWITMTHVCGRWRKILLSMSPLWAAIVCNLPKAFEILLDRARHAPLTIHIPTFTFSAESPKRMKFILGIVLTRMNKIRFLRCSIPAGPQHEQARDALSSGTHLDLHYLCLDFLDTNSSRFKEVLRLDAPNLKAASLSGIRCHLTSLHLRSLQIMKFGSCEQNGLEYFLQLLQDTPALEDLLFVIDRGSLFIAASSVEGSVHLAHLKRLCARAYVQEENLLSNVDVLFRYLTFPLQCSIHCTVNAHDLQTGWQSASGALGHRLRQLPYNAVALTSSDSNYEQTFDISAFDTHKCSASFGQFPAPYINETCCALDFHELEDEEGKPQLPAPGVRLGAFTASSAGGWPLDMLLAHAIHYLAHETITHLALSLASGPRGTDHSSICTALCSLSAVEVLFIVNVNEDPMWMLRAFAAENATDAILPRLRELIVGGIGPQTDRDVRGYESWWNSLLDVLKHRDNIGRPVDILRLTGTWNRSNNVVTIQNTDNNNALRVRDMGVEFCDDRVWL